MGSGKAPAGVSLPWSLSESSGVPWKSLRCRIELGCRARKVNRRSEIVIFAGRGGGIGALKIRVQ